jgi:hypothetical protein
MIGDSFRRNDLLVALVEQLSLAQTVPICRRDFFNPIQILTDDLWHRVDHHSSAVRDRVLGIYESHDSHFSLQSELLGYLISLHILPQQPPKASDGIDVCLL